MVLETYKITLKNDNGTCTVTVASLNGEQGAITQVMACEDCPIGAIVKIKKNPSEINHLKFTAMNIGVITYKKYDENVLLNAHFNIDELFNIILHDKDFVRFEIFDNDKKLLASTYYPNVDGKGLYIHPVKVFKDEELKWTDYNGYRNPSTIRHYKVTWKVDGAVFKTKKKATVYAEISNEKQVRQILQFIDRNSQ